MEISWPIIVGTFVPIVGVATTAWGCKTARWPFVICGLALIFYNRVLPGGFPIELRLGIAAILLIIPFLFRPKSDLEEL